MDIRDFFSHKRNNTSEPDFRTDLEALDDAPYLPTCTDEVEEQHHMPQQKKQHLTAGERKKMYKSKLTFKKEWEKKYPWVTCTDASKGMFCRTCQKWGSPSAGSRGAWTAREVSDWNHATELLKQHAHSQCHRDAAATAAMAQQVESGA